MQPGRPIYQQTLLKLARQLGTARRTVYDHLDTDAIPERFIQPIGCGDTVLRLPRWLIARRFDLLRAPIHCDASARVAGSGQFQSSGKHHFQTLGNGVFSLLCWNV